MSAVGIGAKARAMMGARGDSEKREPSFVGCEAARDTFRGCVGEVL